MYTEEQLIRIEHRLRFALKEMFKQNTVQEFNGFIALGMDMIQHGYGIEEIKHQFRGLYIALYTMTE
jgi:hypothetical protein